MSIVITGATGRLGRHVVRALLDRGVPPAEIVATGRSTEKLADLASQGVRTRAMDYDDATSVTAALAGARRVLLISGSDPGRDRSAQHRTVIDAAKAQGVELLAYTSIANADTNSTLLAKDHRATEADLAESGLPHALLRNSFYLENWTDQIQDTVERGALVGSARDGRVSGAARADYAAAAAAVLVADDQAGRVYELGGDEAFTMTELAAEIAAASGKPVVYRDLPAAEHVAVLTDAGVPQPFAEILADSDAGISRGVLLVAGHDLSTLVGHPSTALSEAVRAALPAS